MAQLELRVGAHNNHGWVAVSPGERWLVGATARRVGTGTGQIRYKVRWRTAAGANTVATVHTVTPTGTDTRVVQEWTVPAGTVEAALAITDVSTGPSEALEVIDPVFERRTSTERVEVGAIITDRIAQFGVTEDRQASGSTSTRVMADLAATEGKMADNAVSTRVIQALAVLEAKMADNATSTRVLAQFAVTEPKNADNSSSRRTIPALAIDNARVDTNAVDRRTVSPDAIGTVEIDANVDILGIITTGSGLSLGGVAASDLDFPGSASMGDNAGGGGIVCNVGANAVHSTGDFTAIGGFFVISARATKKAVREVSLDDAKRLLTVAPVTFNMKDEVMREEKKRVIPAQDVVDRATGKKTRTRLRVIPGTTDRRRRAGFIAEDLLETGLPGLATEPTEERHAGNVLGGMEPYHHRLIQDLYEQIADLRAEVAEVRAPQEATT